MIYSSPQFNLRNNTIDNIVKNINNIINRNQKLDNRLLDLIKNGYCIRLCYTQQTKLLSINKVKNEYRIVIGRPSSHLCKQVYCVVIVD